MKKTLSILLIAIFALNFVGVTLIFKAQQYQIRREIKRQIKGGLATNELFAIRVNNSNSNGLDWQEDNEFIYKGNLYDIVRSKINTDGSVTYYCINDSQEKELFANLDELVKKKTDPNNPAGNAAYKWFQLLASAYFYQTEFMFWNEAIVSESHVYNAKSYQSPFTQINYPPPRNVAFAG